MHALARAALDEKTEHHASALFFVWGGQAQPMRRRLTAVRNLLASFIRQPQKLVVILAETGIQFDFSLDSITCQRLKWIPAFAGMTRLKGRVAT